MRRPSLSKLAPAACVLAAGLFFAGRAEAQCDVNNPLMLCPLAVCIQLQSEVHAPDSCGPPAPQACRNVQGCAALKQMKQRWLTCYTARVRINMRCFAGGDMGHQIQAAQAILNVGACTVLIAQPPPDGCGECP